MEFSNPLLNRTFHSIFYSVLYIITSPVLQLVLYQVMKFRQVWFGLGLMHLLIVMYFPSFIVSVIVVCVQISENYDNYQRSPFFLSFGQIFTLGALTAMQVCSDYLALTINTTVDLQAQSTGGKQPLIVWDLLRYLML